MEHHPDALEVEDDIRHILLNPGDGGKFMKNAVKTYRYDGRPLD